MVQRILAVMLTKSIKRGGFCVAGIRCRDRAFIRFVSTDSKSHGALGAGHMTCYDGHICEPLDLVRVPVLGPAHTPHQPENWLVDPGRRWEYMCTVSQRQALSLHPICRHGKLFGAEAYVTEEKLPGVSLVLAEVSELTILRPRRRTKANFLYNGLRYKHISVTDPDYFDAEEGLEIGRAVLLVSLPDAPFRDGYYYKFVAKIFPL